jgi:Co/Zn/Cd efflux system component
MGVFGLWVLGVATWHAWHGTLPHAFTIGAVGFAALVANAASFGLLWAHRGGDSNMRSAWICTRNDVLGNLAVLLAALGVFGTGTGWRLVPLTYMALLETTGLVAHWSDPICRTVTPASHHTFTSMPVAYITVIPSAIPLIAVGDASVSAAPPRPRDR